MAGMAQSAIGAERDEALARRAAEWTFELVAVPSVTGTADEAAFPEWLRQRLATLNKVLYGQIALPAPAN